MKVTGYSQNNLPKQSFGMKIKFNPEDVKKGGIPCVDTMIEALTKTNADAEIAKLAPDQVRLHYKGVKPDYSDSLFGIGATLNHCWHMVFGDFKPKVILTNEDNSVQQIYNRIQRKALDFAESIVEQQAQRAEEAARVEAVAQKIKDAGLV